MLSRSFPIRYLAFAICVLGAIIFSVLKWWAPQSTVYLILAIVFTFLTAIGCLDVIQTRRAIRRNYPILAHLRFFFEAVRPELRQYIVESDTEELPFSRVQRSIVYQRAKNCIDKRPFGTQLNTYQLHYEWINHSLAATQLLSHDFRLSIGGSECRQKYSASIFNISAMSYGALSPNAILALNAGAKKGGFYHDTGEGSISEYHLKSGGDLVWEIGSGYFGCRNADGSFNETLFAKNASHESVKMIELKLSQGAKPGHGGVLPGAKVSAAIARARGVEIGADCISPANHSAFDSPRGLLEFVAKLRELSAGKPVGIKLAIGHPWEWFAIVKAMLATGITPDFIVVDGGEGGTGAAPLEFTDHVGAPLREALWLVHNTLVGAGIRDRIRIGASGKIITAFDLVKTIAMGADWCNAARGFMFALGCIQAQSCHTDRCPTGVTTQDPSRYRALVVNDKAERVSNFHQNTMKALKELIEAAGLHDPQELGPEHIIRRVSSTEVRSLAALYQWVRPGQLLESGVPKHPAFETFWQDADENSFAAPSKLLNLRQTRLI